MPISLQRNATTGDEPVSLDELKAAMRIDFDDDDALLTALLLAARQRAEDITGRTLVTSTWTYFLDSFPFGWQTDLAPARSTMNRFINWWAYSQAIRIPRGPLQSVESIQYLPGTSGPYVTLDPSNYMIDTASAPGIVYPAPNYYWPLNNYAQHNAVQINFTSGYTVVPEPIKVAMKLMATYWYENKVDSALVPKVAEMLLKAYKEQPVGYVDR
jgi:uncharacterized phiE125 gp8 family phage protein